MSAHRVRVEPEHLADVDERKKPVPLLAAHPGLGLGRQTMGANVAVPATRLDAPYRILQNREHEGARPGRVAIPAGAPDTCADRTADGSQGTVSKTLVI